MPNFQVDFEDGKSYSIQAAHREAAIERARKRYKLKNGRPGIIKHIRQKRGRA